LQPALLGKAGAECEYAFNPDSHLADVDATGQITQGGAMGQTRTERERLAELEAQLTFQNQTLRAIRVVAEKAPPEEARRALRAIGSLAEEALARGHAGG